MPRGRHGVSQRCDRFYKSSHGRSLSIGSCSSLFSWPPFGIRPIAIAFTLRRLASKCANSFDVKSLSYFYHHQLGVGTPGSCEAAVHSARRYAEALPKNHVLVKLDFTNAFNSIHRDEMLLSIHSRLPELYAYCHSAYRQPSFFGFWLIHCSLPGRRSTR